MSKPPKSEEEALLDLGLVRLPASTCPGSHITRGFRRLCTPPAGRGGGGRAARGWPEEPVRTPDDTGGGFRTAGEACGWVRDAEPDTRDAFG